MSDTWRWPYDRTHHLSGTAGPLTFVGGAGDFDQRGAIRNRGDLDAQIDGAVANIAIALGGESATLADVVRLKAHFTADVDDWHVIARIAALFPDDPMPAISTVPDPLQPFDGQVVQIQAIAERGWRDLDDIRVAERPVPARWRDRFGGRAVTGGLRAGEFIAVSNRTAETGDGAVEGQDDAIAQSHAIMAMHRETLAQLGAGFQDAVKMEGYYFGTTREEWRPLAEARASHFAEPGPVATVVPCHRLNPKDALTKIEVMAMREEWNGFDKYIPRLDWWPKRVWDWQIPLPYRQAIALRDTIWLGGQVPSEPFSNTSKPMYPGNLVDQTRLVMSYLEDLLRGYDRSTADLKLMVCYFTCPDGAATTKLFLDTVAETIGGALPPTTLVPKPGMHTPMGTVEIWGVAQL
jgi:enamine deaminase RidA (YjgF/YER057c/UK114 family)